MKTYLQKLLLRLKKIKDIEDNVDYDKLFFTGGNKKAYGFNSFKRLKS